MHVDVESGKSLPFLVEIRLSTHRSLKGVLIAFILP